MVMRKSHTCPSIQDYCDVWPSSWVHTLHHCTSDNKHLIACLTHWLKVKLYCSMQSFLSKEKPKPWRRIWKKTEEGPWVKKELAYSEADESTVPWELKGALSFLSWAYTGLRWAVGGWKETREGWSRLGDLGLCWQMVGSATLASCSEC